MYPEPEDFLSLSNTEREAGLDKILAYTCYFGVLVLLWIVYLTRRRRLRD